MTDDGDAWADEDEPSLEDFEAADQDGDGARPVTVRVLRAVVVMLVIVAMLLYFAGPFYNVFDSAPFRWLRPSTGTHPIPLAPEHENPPMLDV